MFYSIPIEVMNIPASQTVEINKQEQSFNKIL